MMSSDSVEETEEEEKQQTKHIQTLMLMQQANKQILIKKEINIYVIIT
jgi:hypothetical protein